MKLIDILVQELPGRGGWPDGCYAITQDSDKAINEYSSPDGVEINEHGTWRAVKSWNDYCIRAVDAPCLAEDSHTAIITRDQYEAAMAASKRCSHDWIPSEGRTASGVVCRKCGDYNGPGSEAKTDTDGWIDWDGGECPVDTKTLVDIKLKDGCTYKSCHPGDYSWRHGWHNVDIIAYRLHKPQEVTEADEEADLNDCIGQDVALAWSGEGLPPVGCEVEYITGILGKPDADDNKPENGQIVRVVAHAKYEDTGNDVVVATWLNGNGGMRASVFSHKCLQPIRSEADKKRDEAVTAMLSVFGSNAATGTTAALKAIYDAIAAGKIPDVKLED